MRRIINNRVDLDAIVGTPEHARFMAFLAGTINRWRWVSADQEWVLEQRTRTIARYGFTFDDFPDAPVPPKPEYNKDEYDLERERESMVCTRYQARAALFDAGMLDDVEALMEDPETDRYIRLMWAEKANMQRTHDAVVAMASQLGWSPAETDNLFRAAMQVED